MNYWLLAGGLANILAGFLHIGVIIFGASWYQFFGAGQSMVQMVKEGGIFPHLLTLAIALLLFGWGVYAFAGAYHSFVLPYTRWVILCITSVYLIRGIGGFFIKPDIDYTQAFLWYSSAICIIIGGIHAIGLIQVWRQLEQ